jgi:hypothetical protein
MKKLKFTLNIQQRVQNVYPEPKYPSLTFVIG